MKLALHIAWRYLFARKSHNVINVISAISAVGMAVGTAALILILSVYNGFDRIIESNISDLDPDLRVQAASGKFFAPDSVLNVLGVQGVNKAAAAARPARDFAEQSWKGLEAVGSGGVPPSNSSAEGGIVSEGFQPRTGCNATDGAEAVFTVAAVLEDNVFLSYGEGQTIVRARGVPDDYISGGVMAEHLREGGPAMHRGDIPLASVGAGIATKLGISPRFVEGLKLYYPDRDGAISMANPSASLRDAVVFPGSTFAISTDIDNSLVLVPIDVMHNLLGESGVSGIEVRICEQGVAPENVSESFSLRILLNKICPMSQKRMVRRLKNEISEALGPRYVVLDRYQMHPTLFRMMKLEKAAIYMILLFVVIIVAFNIFGSLSMLVIEKSSDMAMIRAMGGTDSFVRDVFRLEGWLISLFGLVVGLVFGVGLTLLQQRFGLVKLPGNFLIDAYPVALEFSDVLLTACGVALIGFLVSLLAAPNDP